MPTSWQLELLVSVECISAYHHIYLLAALYIPTRGVTYGKKLGQLTALLKKEQENFPDDGDRFNQDLAIVDATHRRGTDIIMNDVSRLCRFDMHETSYWQSNQLTGGIKLPIDMVAFEESIQRGHRSPCSLSSSS